MAKFKSELDKLAQCLAEPSSRQPLGDLLVKALDWSEDFAEDQAPDLINAVRADERFRVVDSGQEPIEPHEAIIELKSDRMAPRQSGPSPKREPEILIEYRITKIQEEVSSVTARIEVIREIVGTGTPPNGPTILEWIRQSEPLVREVERISKNLTLHLGSDEFKRESDTFRSHSQHLWFVLPTWDAMENFQRLSLIGAIVVIVGLFVGGTWQISGYVRDFSEIKAQVAELKAANANASSGSAELLPKYPIPSSGQAPAPAPSVSVGAPGAVAPAR